MDDLLFRGNLVQSNRILYTPSVFAKSTLIHLQETGELKALHSHTSRREKLNSYLFFIVLEGSGTVQYEHKEVPISAGQCIFVNCNKSYSHCSSANDPWRLKWVHFFGPNMDAIYDKYLARGGKWCFPSEYIKKYEDLLQEIFAIANTDDAVRDMKLFEKLTSLLAVLMEETVTSDSSSIQPTAAKTKLLAIKEYIDQHYTEKIQLDTLASQFYINKFYLTRLFKDQFGISINNYIIHQRVTKGKQLLRFTDDTIENISRQCGVDDAGYFTRMFKKIEGVAPGEFRRSWVKG